VPVKDAAVSAKSSKDGQKCNGTKRHPMQEGEKENRAVVLSSFCGFLRE